MESEITCKNCGKAITPWINGYWVHSNISNPYRMYCKLNVKNVDIAEPFEPGQIIDVEA